MFSCFLLHMSWRPQNILSLLITSADHLYGYSQQSHLSSDFSKITIILSGIYIPILPHWIMSCLKTSLVKSLWYLYTCSLSHRLQYNNTLHAWDGLHEHISAICFCLLLISCISPNLSFGSIPPPTSSRP